MSYAKSLPSVGPQIAVMVQEFMTAMGQEPNFGTQLGLIAEEADEFMRACIDIEDDRSIEAAENLVKEFADLHYVSTGLMVVLDSVGAEAAKEAMAHPDTVSRMVRMDLASGGVEILMDEGVLDNRILMEAVTRVHKSNMSKLDDDGLPIRREDGKILKGPNYVEPDLSDLATTVLERFVDFRG